MRPSSPTSRPPYALAPLLLFPARPRGPARARRGRGPAGHGDRPRHDAGAVDYLLKPYSRARFRKAVERALDRDDIRWIEAAGDYAKLHTAEKTYLSSTGIEALADRLDPKRFVRVHRSHIIAFPAVDHLRSDGSGGYQAILDDGTTVRVSRPYAPDIRDRLV